MFLNELSQNTDILYFVVAAIGLKVSITAICAHYSSDQKCKTGVVICETKQLSFRFLITSRRGKHVTFLMPLAPKVLG